MEGGNGPDFSKGVSTDHLPDGGMLLGHIGQEIAGFTLMCLMEDMHQRPVLHLRIDSTDMEAEVTRPGSHEIQLKLPPLWLEPGLYTVYFKILFSGKIAQARYLSDVLHLDVGGKSSGWGAVASCRGCWFAIATHLSRCGFVLSGCSGFLLVMAAGK